VLAKVRACRKREPAKPLKFYKYHCNINHLRDAARSHPGGVLRLASAACFLYPKVGLLGKRLGRHRPASVSGRCA
jgi:hypothetical protein